MAESYFWSETGWYIFTIVLKGEIWKYVRFLILRKESVKYAKSTSLNVTSLKPAVKYNLTSMITTRTMIMKQPLEKNKCVFLIIY